MGLRLVTADERLAEANNKVTMAIFGQAGVGKTSLLHTLNPDDTLCLDLEAGMKSVQAWPGASIPIRAWPDALDIACLIGGPDPAREPNDIFSAAHYEHVASQYGTAIAVDRFRTVFVDSITDLTRIAMGWAQVQPAAFSDRTGKPDTRGAYGLLGREVVKLLKHIQHAPGKNAIFVGGLDRRVDDFNREIWEPQTEGSKTGAELPFIVDQVLTLSMFDYSEQGWAHAPGKGEHRALVCRSPNQWALPAKDRSGNLDVIEEPHLGRLMVKINAPARAVADRFTYTLPQSA